MFCLRIKNNSFLKSMFQNSTHSELKDFLNYNAIQDVQIVFKNEVEKDIVRVSFSFKSLDGTVQKNVFRYKTDPADQRRLLYQVCISCIHSFS